jgi:hypothetical protein
MGPIASKGVMRIMITRDGPAHDTVGGVVDSRSNWTPYWRTFVSISQDYDSQDYDRNFDSFLDRNDQRVFIRGFLDMILR